MIINNFGSQILCVQLSSLSRVSHRCSGRLNFHNWNTKAAAWWLAICLSTTINSIYLGNQDRLEYHCCDKKIPFLIVKLSHLKIDDEIKVNNTTEPSFHRWHTLTFTKTGAFHVHLFFFGSLQCCVKWGDLHLPPFILPLSYSPLIYKQKRGCFKYDSPSVFEKALWDKYPKYTFTQQGLLRHRS